MASTTSVLLQPRHNEWDDLTELLEDLASYSAEPTASLYPIVQAIAEGKETTIAIKSSTLAEFVEHMKEFGIEATAASR